MKTADGLVAGGALIVAVAAVRGGAFYPGERLVVGVMFALLFGLVGLRRLRPSIMKDESAWLALIGWGVVSAVMVAMSPLASKEVLTGWFIAWGLWLIARRPSPNAAAIGSLVLIWAALLVAAGVVFEVVGLGRIRVGGFFENPNFAASLLVTTLPLLSSRPRGSRIWWRVSAGVVMVGGVFLTGSRAALLALVVAGILLLPRGRIRLAGGATGLLAAVAILAWRFVSQPETLAWFRPAIWAGVLRLWAAHPILGVAPGGLTDSAGPQRLLHADHIGHHQYLITFAESTPLGLLVQTGTVGFLIATLALVLWVRGVHRSGALAKPGLQSAMAAIVIIAAFHDYVTISFVVWWWALTLGFLESGRPAIDGEVSHGTAAGWHGVVRAAILSSVILWGIVQPAWARWIWQTGPKDQAAASAAVAAEPWYSGPRHWRARELLDNDRWTWQVAAEALIVSGQAVRVHPGSARLWLTLGHVHYRIVNELGPWPDSVSGAREAFERAAELEPHQPWSWLEWARLERGLGKLGESAALARRAVEAEPNLIRAQLFLARVEIDRANLHLARAALERAETSRRMRGDTGLSDYEKELLMAPDWQFRQIEEALQ